MSRRSWGFAVLCALCVGAGIGRGLFRERRTPPLVNPIPEPYRPRSPTSCAAWLGDELVTTFADGGRAVEGAEGRPVRNLSGAGWVQELPEGRALAVIAGKVAALGAEGAPGLVVVTSPDPLVAFVTDAGRAVWVHSVEEDAVSTLTRVPIDESTAEARLVSLPVGAARVFGALEDGTFLVRGVLGGLARAREGGELLPVPEAVSSLTAPATEDGRWFTSNEHGASALVEVSWVDPPTVLQRAALPGRPVRVRADEDGPVALVSGVEGYLVLWWLDATGEHTRALPWAVQDGCLALRGARIGVVAQGRAWAVDRQTGEAWAL